MAFTHRFTQTYNTDVGQIATATQSFTGDEENDFDGQVPANTTNQAATLQVIKANMVSVLIYSDQALTIKTNSSSTPQDTIVLAAGVPVIWNSSMSAAAPFSGNVTNMFLTNAGSVVANVKIRVLTQQ